ncbi:hypothetical protein MU1_36110 [Paenibacillus glycanilyticus]|uniref:ABC transmembrane type-1 domain-containing protein n=1 Tax=Paenibacillus glycanilyticus TaxID=126569 RepID=A0ABQ6GIZ3_9BACL|nr:hypothetical protein MU1_36110 [Paenibacillus glycanilyticus]
MHKMRQEVSKKTIGGSWRPFIKLLLDTKPSKWMIGIAAGLSILSTIVGLIVPLFTKNVVDRFSIANISITQIVLLGVAFLGQAAASGISIYMLNRVGQKRSSKFARPVMEEAARINHPLFR